VVASSAPTTSRSSALFGDDDLDFMKPKPKASEPAAEPVVAQSAPSNTIPLPVPSKARSSDLFDSDDESDDGSRDTKNKPLAARIAGLDPSKIIMPGMSPPPKAKPAPKPASTEDSSDGSEQRDSLAGANMERATFSRTRRAPSRKTFASVAEEDEWGDGLTSFASPAPPPLAMPKDGLSTLFFGDAADQPAPSIPAPAPAPVPKKAGSSLFGDDEPLATSAASSRMSSLFDDATDRPALAPVPKKAGSSLFGDDEPLATSAASSRMSSLFDDAPPARSSVAASRPSLFDDALFGGSSGGDSNKSNLFGDPLFGGSGKPDKKKSLFND
jgi:WASH complex subunit FAM21